jgi:hypothetical protein
MKIAIFLVSVLLSATVHADPVSDAYLRQLSVLEQDLVPLIEAVPTERYGFRPTDDVRTFGEQVKHAATMIYMTAAIVLEEPSPYGPGTNDNGPDLIQTKENIVDYLKASLEYARRAMKSLSEKNHLDPLKTYFGTQLRIEVAAGVMYHSYNHYGQMVVYARLNRIVPPASRR